MIDDFDTLPKLPTKQDSTELRDKLAKIIWEYKDPLKTLVIGEIQALYAPVIEQAKKSGYDQHVRHMFSIEDAQSLKITELRERLDTTYTEGYMANKPEVFEAGKKEERERILSILARGEMNQPHGTHFHHYALTTEQVESIKFDGGISREHSNEGQALKEGSE